MKSCFELTPTDISGLDIRHQALMCQPNDQVPESRSPPRAEMFTAEYFECSQVFVYGATWNTHTQDLYSGFVHFFQAAV